MGYFLGTLYHIIYYIMKVKFRNSNCIASSGYHI